MKTNQILRFFLSFLGTFCHKGFLTAFKTAQNFDFFKEKIVLSDGPFSQF
jgi:hypothetical protein